MWGNRRDENTSPYLCQRINNYVHNKLGPVFMATKNYVEKCSKDRCAGSGRCIKKGLYGALDYAYYHSCQQTAKSLEKMLSNQKQVIGVSSTGETKVININHFKDKLKGLKSSLAKMEENNSFKNRTLNKTSKPSTHLEAKFNDKITVVQENWNSSHAKNGSFVKIVKAERIPFLDADFAGNINSENHK